MRGRGAQCAVQDGHQVARPTPVSECLGLSYPPGGEGGTRGCECCSKRDMDHDVLVALPRPIHPGRPRGALSVAPSTSRARTVRAGVELRRGLRPVPEPPQRLNGALDGVLGVVRLDLDQALAPCTTHQSSHTAPVTGSLPSRHAARPRRHAASTPRTVPPRPPAQCFASARVTSPEVDCSHQAVAVGTDGAAPGDWRVRDER